MQYQHHVPMHQTSESCRQNEHGALTHPVAHVIRGSCCVFLFCCTLVYKCWAVYLSQTPEWMRYLSAVCVYTFPMSLLQE